MYLAWSYEGEATDSAWRMRRQNKLLHPAFWEELLGVMDIFVTHKLLYPIRFVFQLEQGELALTVPDEIKDQPQRLVAYLQASLAETYFESILEVDGETYLSTDGNRTHQTSVGLLRITEFDGLSQRFSFMLNPWPFVPLTPLGNLEYSFKKGSAWQENASCLKLALGDLDRFLSDWKPYPGQDEVVVDEVFVQSGTGILIHPNVLDLVDADGDAQIASMRQEAISWLSKRE
jgi:hypothetical protein